MSQQMQLLTERQAAVLSLITDRIKQAGLAPTRQEISAHFGWSSANAAQTHIAELARKGYVLLGSGDFRWRGIRVRMDGDAWSVPVSMRQRWFQNRTRDISAERVREVLDYRPETGAFTWKSLVGKHSRLNGTQAGGLDPKGYLRISVGGLQHMAHRLAWLVTTGAWPVGRLDHINGNKQDNRIANLREVSASINSQNRVKPGRRSVSGALGVVRSKGKWEARITVDGKWTYLGRFDSTDEASAAYFRAKAQLHAGFVPARLQEISS